MIQVTESALPLLKEILAKVPPGRVLRLEAKRGSNYRISLDEPHEGDVQVDHEGTVMLYVARDVAADLEASFIVGQSTAGGPQLAVSTPQRYPMGPISQVISVDL